MYGKLGHGGETGRSSPTLVEALAGMVVRRVGCGSRHTVALTDDSEVLTWGDTDNGVSGHDNMVGRGHQYLPLLLKYLEGR